MLSRREMFVCMAGGMLVLAGCGKKAAPTENANEVSEFWKVVDDGDAESAERLLRLRPYLANAKNPSGQTPLAAAKQKGNEDLAEAIRKAGGKE
jgi:hypothetical protein